MPDKVAYELKDGFTRVEINVQDLDEVVVVTADRETPLEAEKGSSLAAAFDASPGLKLAEPAKGKTDKRPAAAEEAKA
jgi:hypothetical protein